MIILLVIMSIMLTAVGQLLLKQSVFVKNYKWFFLCSGYFSFFITVLMSYFLMKLIELKTFAVIMSINYVVVMILSALIFKEKMCKNKVIGTVFVLLGVIVFNV